MIYSDFSRLMVRALADLGSGPLGSPWRIGVCATSGVFVSANGNMVLGMSGVAVSASEPIPIMVLDHVVNLYKYVSYVYNRGN